MELESDEMFKLLKVKMAEWAIQARYVATTTAQGASSVSSKGKKK